MQTLISGFEVRREDRGEISVLHIRGFLDAPTAPVLEEQFERLVNEGRYSVVVNFSELTYIGSAGIGVFLGFLEAFRDHGGDIKLSNLNQRVLAVFDLLGFPELIEIYEEEAQACGGFSH